VARGDPDHPGGEVKDERTALARRETVARRAIDAAERARLQQATLSTTIAALRSQIAGADPKTRRAIVEAVVPLETGCIRLNPDYSFTIHGVLPVISNAAMPEAEPAAESDDDGGSEGGGDGGSGCASPEGAVGGTSSTDRTKHSLDSAPWSTP